MQANLSGKMLRRYPASVMQHHARFDVTATAKKIWSNPSDNWMGFMGILTVDQVRVFLAVVGHGSFPKAAKALRRNQSAVG